MHRLAPTPGAITYRMMPMVMITSAFDALPPARECSFSPTETVTTTCERESSTGFNHFAAARSLAQICAFKRSRSSRSRASCRCVCLGAAAWSFLFALSRRRHHHQVRS